MQRLNSILEEAIRSYKKTIPLSSHITENIVWHAIHQVMRDNPDIFWFPHHQWKFKKNIVYFHYTLKKERGEKAKIQIDDVVRNDFSIEKVRKLSPVEQVMYVYKWIALYSRYNVQSAHNQTIYSVFVYRNSVCTGFAKAAQYLFQLLDIESKLVFGRMKNGDVDSRHCWLIVQINGKWYHLDPSFAMPETACLLRESGVEPVIGHDGLHYNFFCLDTDTIKQSRTIEDENTLPRCYDIIDYVIHQNIEVCPSRRGNSGGLGCLLSDTGSTADIYLAHNAKNYGKISVAKVFRKDPNHELLRKELKIMRECAGEAHLLRATNADFDRGILYVEQATALSELLASHYFKMTVNGFCHLLLDIIAGLKELLRHGIIYRDIHLKNIYLSDTIENGRNIYKIGDFGSCTFFDGEEKYDRLADKGGVGSKWYMAPETWSCGVFDERSAVYSVGMVAYHLLNNLCPPLWQQYGEKSHELRINGMQLPKPYKLEIQEYEHIHMPFLKNAINYAQSDRYESLSALENAIHKCISENQQYGNLIIIYGAEVQNDEPKQPMVDFCSTCIDNPFIEVSNGEAKDNSYNTDFDGTYDLSIDTRKGYVSFIPQINFYVENARNEMSKAAKHSCGFLGWLISKRNRKKSIKSSQLSTVNSSVFAPSEIKRGDYLMVQVFLYQDGEENIVYRKAAEVDANAKRRNYTPLCVRLKRGDVVKVMLTTTATGVEVQEPIQELMWNGHYTDCQLCMFIPNSFSASTLISTVTLSVNGIPAGRMMFKTNVIDNPHKLYAEIVSKSFNKIFISYSHKDESRVKYLAEAYKAQGVDYFFDRHYLKAGDVYPVKIQQYIDSADLFILCWSKNAAMSEYVTLERKQAMFHAYPQVSIDKATITIHPISIEPRAEYPTDMNDVYNFEEV